MVIGGAAGLAAGAAFCAAVSRGGASVTTLVARPLGAGRSTGCAVNAVALVRASTTGKERKRMGRTEAAGVLEPDRGRARAEERKLHRVTPGVNPDRGPGHFHEDSCP